ncbi:MAG: hypothetical protein ACLPV8_25445 [Steroidobacteraceae bacterium]
MSAKVLERLETSFAISLERFVEGLTTRQIRQHAELFEVALRALDTYLASPDGQGLAPDIARFWNFERANFHRHAAQLNQILESRGDATQVKDWTDDPALERIKSLLASKTRGEWLHVRDDLVADVRGQLGPLHCPERNALRRKELAFLLAAIENPEGFEL